MSMQVPWKRRYLAGWGYLLSRDVVWHVVNNTLHWEKDPDQAPGWYAGLHWEDVMVGLIAGEMVGQPQVMAPLKDDIANNVSSVKGSFGAFKHAGIGTSVWASLIMSGFSMSLILPATFCCSSDHRVGVIVVATKH